MNLLTKTTPWMVASLLAVTSVFGQDKCSSRQDRCPPPPCPAPCDFKEATPGMPGYNSPSGINVCGSWDVFASASFIYWQPSQDNLDYALTDTITLTNLGTNGFGFNGDFVEMNFKFKPGFKVALGVNFDNDNWDGFAEYTRVHGTHTASTNGPATPGFLLPTWGHPGLIDGIQAMRTANASFKCNLDFVDAMLGREYFVGKCLRFHPVVGARAAWITESMTVRYNNPSDGTGVAQTTVNGVTSTFGSVDVFSRVHSWGLGPRMGLETNWHVGQGIRFINNGYLDVLYTSYRLKDKTVTNAFASSTSGPILTGTTKTKVGTIRTHVDLEMGLGWGSYFDNNNWHIDLSATYGFQVFFDQNMFRKYVDDIIFGNSFVPNGNLYVQGLTATVRLDF